MSDWVWAAVLGVGGLGAIARFLLDSLIAERAGRDFPYGTFTINISGALILGLLTGLGVGGNLLLIAGTATIGSFTTFSTWMLESSRLAEDKEYQRSMINLALSLLAGFAAALAGNAIGAHA
jgi:fluoride exporter